MAMKFSYYVRKMDGTCGQIFHNQKKAEDYARSLKANDADKIPITRTTTGMAPYTYYI